MARTDRRTRRKAPSPSDNKPYLNNRALSLGDDICLACRQPKTTYEIEAYEATFKTLMEGGSNNCLRCGLVVMCLNTFLTEPITCTSSEVVEVILHSYEMLELRCVGSHVVLAIFSTPGELFDRA
jgi:hypothetical protein